MLERLDPTSRTLFAQVGRSFRAAVLASGLPRLPKGVRARVRVRRWVVEDICMSVERLAWAKANGEAVQVDPIKPKLKPLGSELFELKCDVLLSNLVFESNLRRYRTGAGGARTCVLTPRRQGGLMCCGGRGSTTARGTRSPVGGRGLHSSTSQLNLGCFCH